QKSNSHLLAGPVGNFDGDSRPACPGTPPLLISWRIKDTEILSLFSPLKKHDKIRQRIREDFRRPGGEERARWGRPNLCRRPPYTNSPLRIATARRCAWTRTRGRSSSSSTSPPNGWYLSRLRGSFLGSFCFIHVGVWRTEYSSLSSHQRVHGD
uniref:Uncharacterized protein n=1 Tax=Triticum urartu TaxID=4572 RepID=A0A8R7U5U7_TRIUA